MEKNIGMISRPSSEQMLGTMPSSQAYTHLHQLLRRNSTPNYYHSTPVSRYYRRGVTRSTSIPPYRNNSFPMTVNTLAKAKLSGNMDLFGPDFLYSPGSDHVLPNGDLPMYAASPNSLYLYEQERNDMQNLGTTQCYTSPQTNIKKEFFSCEDFDLNPQYEANLELPNNSITDTDVQQNFTAFSAQSQNGRNSNPTLTELNMGNESESFLEDLEAVIPKTPSFSNSISTFSSVSQQNNTFTTLTTRTNDSFPNNNYGLKTASSWPSWNSQSQVDQRKTIQNIKTALQNSKSLPFTHTVTSTSSNSSLYSEDNKSQLQKLLMADDDDSPVTSVVGVKRPLMSIKEEKDDDSVEEKWKEIEKYIHDDEDDMKDSRPTREKRKRFDSESSMTGSLDDSNEDDDSSDEEFSDGEMDMSHLNNTSVLEDGKKGEKFFWQYNVQSKGPKGTKLKLHLDSKNPHKLKNFEDPVFDPNNTKSGIRHGGKARKGDGNDIVPSPRKLFNLGVQIRKLNHMINEITANNDQPASIRNELRKKKNKLASRACRLKKKAQHEANKVKLFGIGKEHSQLIEVIKTIKGELKKKAREVDDNNISSNKENLIGILDELIANKLTDRIAGNTTVYVNSVIKTVEGGDSTGGIPSARK